MSDLHPRLLPLLPVSNPTKSSILQSKREIDEVLNTARRSEPSANDQANHCLFINRQITSGGVLDWKEFKKEGLRQSELSIRDVEKGDRPVFEMFIEEWKDGEPSKAIYKWIRRPRQPQDNLTEEEHLYRGGLLNRHKHGQGEYLIIRKFNDSSEAIKGIRGTWKCDILESGVLTDQTGQERKVSGNIFRDRSKNKKGGLDTYKISNKTIQQETKKLSGKRPSFLSSSRQIDSKESAVSIMGHEPERNHS